MKNLIGYVIGGILLLMALGSFSGDNYSISTGLLFLLAGILCFPQIIRLVNISLLTKYSAVFIVILVVFALIIQNNNNPIENQSDVTEQNNIENKNDSIQEVINASKKLKETLQREISNINKPFDETKYRGSLANLQIEIVLFQIWSQNISEGEESSDIEVKKLAQTLKSKLISIQVNEYPKMRKHYSSLLGEKLWEENIYVTTQGSKNQIINITGGIFANNKNIAEFQRTLSEVLQQFRFNEIRYRWYKNADKYTGYKYEAKGDNFILK
jgi:hypothetical protein